MPPHADRIDIHHWIHNDELTGGATHQILTQILARLGVLEAQGQELMAIAQTTQAKLDAIDAKLTTVGDSLTTAATGLAADIQALKDALNAANNGMSETDVNNALAPLEAKVAAVAAAAQAITDLDVANP